MIVSGLLNNAIILVGAVSVNEEVVKGDNAQTEGKEAAETSTGEITTIPTNETETGTEEGLIKNTETEVDTATNTETKTETKTETNTENNSESNTKSDKESKTETKTDTNTESNTDTNTETGTVTNTDTATNTSTTSDKVIVEENSSMGGDASMEVNAGTEAGTMVDPMMQNGIPGGKDSLLTSWPFVGGVSLAVMIVSIAIGAFLARRKIKKGIEIYED